MFNHGLYILKNKIPVKASAIDFFVWRKNFDDSRVAQTSIMDDEGEIWISTIFLGLDHNYNPEYKFPILFETLVQGGKHDDLMDRYSSWDEAVTGHRKYVRLARMSVIWERNSEKKKNRV